MVWRRWFAGVWILGLMVVFVSCCLKDAVVGLLGWFMLVSGCWLPFLRCVFWSGGFGGFACVL